MTASRKEQSKIADFEKMWWQLMIVTLALIFSEDNK